MTSASRTEQLLQWLAPSPPQAPDPARLATTDWDDLIAEAVAHTVAPQLFERLLRDANRLPPGVLQCAMLASSRQKQYVANLANELAAIARTLAGKGITPILLKGAHLAMFVYREPGHRPMADLDLLVQSDDLEDANRVLLSLGYTPQYDEPIEVTRSHGHALPLMLKPGCIAVELHWKLCDPTDAVDADIDGIWRRSAEVDILGERARISSAEDLLLHICFHAGVMHNFAEKGLRPLFDVLAIIEHYGSQLDWSVVVSRARQWRIERATWLMLALVRQHHADAIPAEVLKTLEPQNVSRPVLDAAQQQMFERPGVRLTTIRPRQVALALNNPRMFGRNLRTGVVSRYAAFLWNGVRRNRQLLALVVRRTRRQFILNAWLKKNESAL